MKFQTILSRPNLDQPSNLHITCTVSRFYFDRSKVKLTTGNFVKTSRFPNGRNKEIRKKIIQLRGFFAIFFLMATITKKKTNPKTLHLEQVQGFHRIIYPEPMQWADNPVRRHTVMERCYCFQASNKGNTCRNCWKRVKNCPTCCSNLDRLWWTIIFEEEMWDSPIIKTRSWWKGN